MSLNRPLTGNYALSANAMILTEHSGHSPITSLVFWNFSHDPILCTSWRSALRGPCAIAELLIELSPVICRNFYPLFLHSAPPLGWPRSSFVEIFGVNKLESLYYRGSCLHNPKFSRFSRTPTCDRQTDGRIHDRLDDSIYRSGTASRGKNISYRYGNIESWDTYKIFVIGFMTFTTT